MMIKTRHSGFSLVELSIVLVILGLLVGGILAGQALIRASELRAVASEYTRYITAMQSFRDKYFQLPGDINNAQSFWGIAHATAGTCVTTTTSDARTCNGDGNGLIDLSAGSNEHFRFWQHLANAGLIEGTYSGVEASTGFAYHSIPGTNTPRSKISGTTWFTRDMGTRSGHSEMFDGVYANILMFGGVNGTSQPYADTLKPEEAWNIDTKLDDGKPATGMITPGIRVGCAAKVDGSAITTSGADAALTNAIYALATTSNQCALYFRRITG